MQSLNDILHVARENNYSDVHLGGQNNIMIRNNGILYPYEHSYSVDDVVAMILSMLSISQKEKLEQENARLFALSEKELLVEMIFMLKDVVKEQKDLKEKDENCEGDVSLVKTDLYSLSNKVDSLSSDIDMIKYS